MSGRHWAHYTWALLAGAVLASYIALSCGPARSQSQEVATAISRRAAAPRGERGLDAAHPVVREQIAPWVTSRGGHMGIAQFSRRTWAWMSRQAGWAGASPYDPGPPSTPWPGRYGRDTPAIGLADE